MRSRWWRKYYELVRSISQLGMTEESFDEFCNAIEVTCDNYGVNYMGLYIAKPEYYDAFAAYGIETAILTDSTTIPLVTLALDDDDYPREFEPVTQSSVDDALSAEPIVGSTSITASYDLEAIEKVAHNLFNDLMNTHREDLSNHTDKAARLIEDAVRTQYAEYEFDPQDIGEIIDAVFDTVDSYNSSWGDYYGKFAYDKYGSMISNSFQKMIVSKRIDDLDKDYQDGAGVIGLRAIAKHIGTTTSMVLQALEGMCYNNTACEIDDSHYFVGSYEDWEKVEAYL